MSNVVILDKHKDLFKDEKAFLAFTRLLEEALANNDMPLLICNESLLGAFISPDEAGERLRGQIVKRMATNPAALELLKGRLESDDLVS